MRVTVDWGGYEPDVMTVSGPLEQVSRAEARREFDRVMQTRATRIAGLRRLLASNGVALGDDEGSVQALNDWYSSHVEPDPRRPPGHLRPPWYSVSHDIALFLGELILARHPNLRWEFVTGGRRGIDYQQHVIMGFRSEKARFRTSMNLERMAVSYGHRIIAGQGSTRAQGSVTVRGHTVDVDRSLAVHPTPPVAPDEFVGWLRIAARRNDGPPVRVRDLLAEPSKAAGRARWGLFRRGG